MAVFTEGDSPLSAFEYDLGLDAADADSVELRVLGQVIPADLVGDIVEGDWTGLEVPPVGLYPIRAQLAAAGRTQGVLVDWLVVVAPVDPWHNVETARFEWDGAPANDGTLYRLLTTAREQVEAYGRVLADGEPVPELWRQAQLAQARNMFNASITSGENTYDAGGGNYITVRPLDWAVKQLIRPRSARKALA